jgi:hypothetical protein
MALAEKHIRIPSNRRTLHYRLYRLQHGNDPSNYYLEIRLGNDRFCSLLKTKDLDEARHIYTLMLQGNVTPCTAQDVLEDICP